ncbi:hypothetical protein QR680_013254 [Steinernema hermaphroditum]|uniref:Uncharacterized protein n=1 Tax=Steinernema hermaphroditum TaxID=289476 RepID=A0AA39I4W2_9BILA|nr:hypothetical protein QR680_013254 [Steinernema hermaphroditum]
MTFSRFLLCLLLLGLPLIHSGVIHRTPPGVDLVSRDMVIFFVDDTFVSDGHRRFRRRRGFRKGSVHTASSRKQRRFLSRNFNDQGDEEEGVLVD